MSTPIMLARQDHIESTEQARSNALDAARYRYAVENMEIMDETGNRGYVGREECDPYIDSKIAKELK